MRSWRHAWPGLLATLNGVGLCRFAYTPLIPFMIAAGLVTESGAAYVGAANLIGYLAGAALAAPLGARVGLGPAIRSAFVLSVLALAACIWPGGFWWYVTWRFATGAAGAVLMVLAPSFLLADVDPERAAAAAASSIWASAPASPCRACSCRHSRRRMSAWPGPPSPSPLTTVLTWPRWRGGRPILHVVAPSARLGAPALLVSLAFGMDGIGFVPHMLFWVDYIARSLALGTTAGAAQWLLFGLGAALGPALGGAVSDIIGIGRALVLAFALKAAAVLLAIVATSLPFLTISSLVAGAFTPGIAALTAARITKLVPPGVQTRAWGFATLVFGCFQAVGAYGMAYAYGTLGSYVPLYAAGAVFEALGATLAVAAFILSRRDRV